MALTTNIIAYYKLDNTSDSVGSRTLTNNNSVTFVAGLIGNCADFGSANTNKSLNNTSDNYSYTGGNYTISIWVKLDTEITTGTYGFMELGDNTTSETALYISYSFNGGTRQITFARHKAGIVDDQSNSNLTMGTTAWYNLVLTYDGATVTGYVNNSSVGTVSSSGNGSSSEDQGLTLGEVPRFPTFGSCKVDEAGFWNRVLNSTERTQLYNGGAGLTYPFTNSPGNFLQFM